jgi:cell shape-determining protein MreD
MFTTFFIDKVWQVGLVIGFMVIPKRAYDIVTSLATGYNHDRASWNLLGRRLLGVSRRRTPFAVITKLINSSST